MTDKPLWTDERISEAYLNWQRTAVGRVDVTAFVRHIRDYYQTALDAANQRVVELEGWRTEAHRLRNAIMQLESGNLQQAQLDAANARVAVPDEVREAIEYAHSDTNRTLKFLQEEQKKNNPDVGPDIVILKKNLARIEVARKWLDEQEANDG